MIQAFLQRAARSSVLRLAGAGSILRASSLGLTILSSIVLARVLGPAELGIYAFSLAVVTLIGMPIHMGLPILILRETAKSLAEENLAKVKGMWRWAGRRIAGFTALVMLIALPVILLFGEQIGADGRTMPIWLGLALVPLIGVAQARGGAVRGLGRPIVGSLPDTILRPFLLAATLAALFWAGENLKAEDAMAAHLAAAAIASIIGMAILWKITPEGVRKAAPDNSEQTHWKKALIPFTLLAGVQVIMQNISVLTLGLFSDPAEAGLFKIALSASNLALLGLTAIATLIAPTFVKLHTSGDYKTLQRKAALTSLIGIAFALPFAVAMWFVGEPFIALLYGSEFTSAVAILLVLLIGTTMTAFCGSSTSLLSLSGHEKLVFRIMATAMILAVVANLALVNIFGAIGAAIATSVITLGWNIALIIAVRIRLGLDSTPFGLVSRAAGHG